MSGSGSPKQKKKMLLQTNDGRTATIETTVDLKTFNVMKCIFVKPSQNPETMTVDEHQADDKSIHMAFFFKSGSEQYCPFVSDKDVKVQKVDKKRSNNDNRFFFKWVEERGDFKTLESVAEPKMYLSIAEAFVDGFSMDEPK